jgi:hypothetical protein
MNLLYFLFNDGDDGGPDNVIWTILIGFFLGIITIVYLK